MPSYAGGQEGDSVWGPWKRIGHIGTHDVDAPISPGSRQELAIPAEPNHTDFLSVGATCTLIS